MTGASGCVGQYISRWLLHHSDAELLLWLRDPAKLTAVPADHPRIRLLVGDLRDTDRFAQELASVNRVIHTATAWGCLLYTSPSPRDLSTSRMPSSA